MQLPKNELTAAALRDQLRAVLDGVEHHSSRIRVTRHGRVSAVLVSAADLELLERVEDLLDGREATARLDSVRTGRSDTITIAELRRELSADR